MKNLKTAYILAACLMLPLACAKELPTRQEEEISVKDAAVKGELLIKFSPEAAEILAQAGITKSGISSVDRILEIAGAYEFQRVFPVDPRNEKRTHEAGLDLWYIVRFDEGKDIEEVARELAALGEVSGVEYNHTIKRAYNEGRKAVPYIAGNAVTKASAGADFNDPLLPLQWNLINEGNLWDHGFLKGADVNVVDAWKVNTGCPEVIVAVVDEGIFYNHPDLAASMWHNEGETFASHEDNDGNGYPGDYYGFNFVSGTGQISYSLSADTGHGSHVAGIIAAQNNNGEGISSIAGGNGNIPGVKVMSCQIFSGNYVSSILAEVQAIKYAADNGAVILQCSWGYVSSKANQYDWSPQYGDDESWMKDNPIEKDALMYFINTAGSANGPIEGGIGVFASGNESAAAAGYPGAYGDFVSVIGTAPDYTPAVYTNYGWRTNICAPGGDQDYFYDHIDESGVRGTIGCILSTVPYQISESGYAYFEGSSMATPHVSSALALAISHARSNHRHLKAQEYIKLLYDSATDIDGYMEGTKYYYKYVADLGENHKKKMDLSSFKGKMGCGQLNVSAFLDKVSGAGLPMKFPNVLVAPGESLTYDSEMYLGSLSTPSVNITDTSVAKCTVTGTKVKFTGIKEGRTSCSISAGGKTQDFTITVKETSGNGWL